MPADSEGLDDRPRLASRPAPDERLAIGPGSNRQARRAIVMARAARQPPVPAPARFTAGAFQRIDNARDRGNAGSGGHSAPPPACSAAFADTSGLEESETRGKAAWKPSAFSASAIRAWQVERTGRPSK